MRIVFLFLGKTRESFFAAGIDEYVKRLGRYVQVEVKILKEKKGGGGNLSAEELKKEECRQLIAGISQPSFVVALDEHGSSMSSVRLAEQLSEWESQGQKAVTFLIGGPNGLSVDIIKMADLVLSLSAMTFPHEMARLIILEQVYRAYTIKAGTAYHK